MQSQSERMTTLVEDLLLLARLDEGQPLKLSDVDLTQLAIETVSDEKVMAPDRIWQLELPDEPVVVRGDATQLHQVLANLLSNARKHTDPGTTVVTGVMRSADGSAVVTVTDNGARHRPRNSWTGSLPASPRGRRPHESGARTTPARQASRRRCTCRGVRHRRIAPAAGASAEGTSGLGLSIVQSIVEAHGGTVEVTSRPGRTEFAVRLPAAPPRSRTNAGADRR